MNGNVNKSYFYEFSTSVEPTLMYACTFVFSVIILNTRGCNGYNFTGVSIVIFNNVLDLYCIKLITVLLLVTMKVWANGKNILDKWISE